MKRVRPALSRRVCAPVFQPDRCLALEHGPDFVGDIPEAGEVLAGIQVQNLRRPEPTKDVVVPPQEHSPPALGVESMDDHVVDLRRIFGTRKVCIAQSGSVSVAGPGAISAAWMSATC